MKAFFEEHNWLSRGSKLFLTLAFLAGGQVFSQIESPVSSAAAQIDDAAQPAAAEVKPVDEADHADEIIQQAPFSVDGKKDPFKPLVEKPKPFPIDGGKRTIIPTQVPTAPPTPTTPPVPPIKLGIQGIVGNESERLAMVLFENEMKVLRKDDEVKGKFKVVEILPDKLVIYSIHEGMRRTFTIGGGKE